MNVYLSCRANGYYEAMSLESLDWECVSLNLLECITAGIQLAL